MSLFSAFVCKGLLPLFPTICLHITAAIAYHYMLAKDCSPYFLLFARKDCGPCLLVSFAKDYCPCFCLSLTKDCSHCFLLFICKGLQPLISAIRLQKNCGPVFCYLGTRSFLSTCLQMTAVLFVHYILAKDCYSCYPISICKGLLHCLLLFFCKGLQPSFSDFHLQRIDVLVSAFCLQRTAVLVSCYSFAKECGACFLLLLQRNVSLFHFCL